MTNYQLIGLDLVLLGIFMMMLIISWEIDRFNKRQRYFNRKIETLNHGMSEAINLIAKTITTVPNQNKYLVCHTSLFVYGKTLSLLPGKALTKGDKYAVIKENDKSFTIINDMGGEHEFYKDDSVDGHVYTEWFDEVVEQ